MNEMYYLVGLTDYNVIQDYIRIEVNVTKCATSPKLSSTDKFNDALISYSMNLAYTE
jgi:hypothetical protein